MNVDLTQDESGALSELLEETISDLRMEIADTDQADYRDSIRRRKDLLSGVYRKLTGHELN